MVRYSKIVHPRSGFTLIEVVTSLSIMSVLLLGLSGAVMVGSRAIPSATDIGQSDQVPIDAINRIRSELREASAIRYQVGANEHEMKIRIKDSGASGTPSVIVYRYSLASGTLMRKADAQDAVTLVSGISSLVIEITGDGADASVVYLRMTVEGTIKQVYEMHALLPDKPRVI